MFINLTTAQAKYPLLVNIDNVAFIENDARCSVEVFFSKDHSVFVHETFDEIKTLIAAEKRANAPQPCKSKGK